ncbi:MAG: Holliday junction branch migration DNA helicase RuvB [Candidatus Marinimicrobia bacterium]|nr:Holliday junction branch migration DNA helicase RuvB [Candidatus Neomarinimicrobiota bacterium]|tara:strand:- start:7549 stop:8556 length:1008 start_codon:yes stop_codon:yes gene_type:complete
MIKSEKENKEATNPEKIKEDLNQEQSLRPDSFKDFIGQNELLDNLSVYIKAAQKRSESLDHVLLFGPPGLGKTTLAKIISKEMNVNFKMSSGPILEKAGDLAGILTNLESKDVFFIDEVHRLKTIVEEYLYSAMEDYTIDIMLDKGPNARSIILNLNAFTLVGATTRLGKLTSPLRDRFGVILRLDYYNNLDLFKIIKRSCDILNIKIDDKGAKEIARRSRGTPRIANRILKRARDFAEVESKGVIDYKIADLCLSRLGIDKNGLDNMDRLILDALIDKFEGGPVGIESLSVAISEDAGTVEEVYEPYLIKEGYMQRTSRGRLALEKAYNYLEKK